MKTQYIAAAVLSAMMFNPLSADAAGKDGVAAVVNGQKIMVAEIQKVYDSTPELKAQISFDQFYPRAVAAWANRAVMQQAAQKAGVESSAEYKQQLEEIKSDLAARVYLKQELDKKISENDIKNTYNAYKKNFKSQKEVKARHILVDNETDAKDIITQISHGGDFNSLAQKYSKEKKPDLGYFTQEMMVPEFGEAVFKMKKGEYSKKPIKTNFGYHVVIVDDVRNSKVVPYDEAKNQIRAGLEQEQLPVVLKKTFDNAKIELYQLDGKVMSDPNAATEKK